MARELTDDEADTVMAQVYPAFRERWCPNSCGWPPGETPVPIPACACAGCLGGVLGWDDWQAWRAREAQRDPTPWDTGHLAQKLPPILAERLAAYKASKYSGQPQGLNDGS